MEKIDKKVTGVELFANFTAAAVKYSVLGGYVFFASVAHIINRVKGLERNAGKNKKKV